MIAKKIKRHNCLRRIQLPVTPIGKDTLAPTTAYSSNTRIFRDKKELILGSLVKQPQRLLVTVDYALNDGSIAQVCRLLR
jgi:hypothetical protein